MAEVRPEPLHLLGSNTVPDQAVRHEALCAVQAQAGSDTGTHTMLPHTTLKKQLFGLQWIYLRYDTMERITSIAV
jgi:hypothetical protein